MQSSSEGFVQAYNVQIAVEPELQLIVGQAVTQAANDKEQVQPMVKAVVAQSGQRPKQMLADNGSCSEKNLAYLESAKKPKKKKMTAREREELLIENFVGKLFDDTHNILDQYSLQTVLSKDITQCFMH